MVIFSSDGNEGGGDAQRFTGFDILFTPISRVGNERLYGTQYRHLALQRLQHGEHLLFVGGLTDPCGHHRHGLVVINSGLGIIGLLKATTLDRHDDAGLLIGEVDLILRFR